MRVCFLCVCPCVGVLTEHLLHQLEGIKDAGESIANFGKDAVSGAVEFASETVRPPPTYHHYARR